MTKLSPPPDPKDKDYWTDPEGNVWCWNYHGGDHAMWQRWNPNCEWGPQNGGLEEVPALMCKCGSRTFAIGYGDYECIAKCTECGEETVVYSG